MVPTTHQGSFVTGTAAAGAGSPTAAATTTPVRGRAAMSVPALWHFRISHFNEKARWALDWKGVPHRRHALLPGIHLPRVLWMTWQKAVPFLQIDGKTITDSTRIIAELERRYPEPPLYPADRADRARALALEDFFDEELGPHIRRLLFYHLLPDADLASAALSVGESSTVRGLYRAIFPLIRAAMRFDMGIDANRAERSREKTIAALDRIEAELQPSGYLAGDRFSVADLTAAALLSPLVIPPEFPYPLPPFTAALRECRAALEAHPAFRWATEMYRRHRGTSSEVVA